MCGVSEGGDGGRSPAIEVLLCNAEMEVRINRCICVLFSLSFFFTCVCARLNLITTERSCIFIKGLEVCFLSSSRMGAVGGLQAKERVPQPRLPLSICILQVLFSSPKTPTTSPPPSACLPLCVRVSLSLSFPSSLSLATRVSFDSFFYLVHNHCCQTLCSFK